MLRTSDEPPRADPGTQYRRRLAERRTRQEMLSRLDSRFSMARLVTVAVGLVVAWAVFDPERLALAWLAVPAVVFVGLAIAHERVVHRKERAQRAIAYYERGLERVEDRWDGHGFDGLPYLDSEHPYAGDLDLFGRGSLYQLLCSARTAVGRGTLATWLLEPAEPEEIRRRQEAVGELARDLDLREQIAVFAGDLGDGLHADALVGWANAPAVLPTGAVRWVPPVLALALITSLAGLIASLLV